MMQLFKAYFTQALFSLRPVGLLGPRCIASSSARRDSSRAVPSLLLLQAKYINDPDVLVEAAAAAGFDADEARAVIADPSAYRNEVPADRRCSPNTRQIRRMRSKCRFATESFMPAGQPGAEAGSRSGDWRPILRSWQRRPRVSHQWRSGDPKEGLSGNVSDASMHPQCATNTPDCNGNLT